MIYGFCGAAGSGKTYAADLLCKLIHDSKRHSFSTPLKDMLERTMGFTYEQLYGDKKEIIDDRYGKSPRQIMQTLGTEWGRNMVHPDIWVIAINNQIDSREKVGATVHIIDDVRFENEANYVRSRGVLIHMVGKNCIKSSHSSEDGIKPKREDFTIINDYGCGDAVNLMLLRIAKEAS